MSEVRLLRRGAIAAAWLLATYAAPAVARADPAPVPVTFRLGSAAGSLGTSSAIADFNRDGRPDLAVADRTGTAAATHRFRVQVAVSGRDTVSFEVDSTEPALSLSLTDVDHDDDLDIVLSRPLSGETVSVWLNDGTGRFTSAPVGTVKSPPHPITWINALAAPPGPSSASLVSGKFEASVPPAVIVAVNGDGHVLRGFTQFVPPALSFPASRPRSPPASSLALS